MELQQLKALLPDSQVAELKAGARYLVTYPSGRLDEYTVGVLRKSFEENGIKAVLVDDELKLHYLEPKTDVEVADRSGDPVALYVNKAAESLATQVCEYATTPRALARLADARAYQMKDWPSTSKVDAGGRSTEEWILLLQRYQNKLVEVYAESDGSTKAGLERMAKYAAIQANLALWLLQAAQGQVDNFKETPAPTTEPDVNSSNVNMI